MTRRSFFESLAALVVAPAVPVAPLPVAPIKWELSAEVKASIREAQAQINRLNQYFEERRRTDELARYIHQLTADHHATLNARSLGR